LCTLCLALSSSGCATYSANQTPHDPWENYNRAIYSFNDTLDRYALKPVAKGYKWVTPDFVEKGVSNFFSNIEDVVVTLNDVLQGKFALAAQDSWRFLLNTTLGVGGIFDVATPLGLAKHSEDFGQTLGKWGVAEGPYLMLPFLGPATVRSASGRLIDWPTDPLTYINPAITRYSLTGVEFVDNRAQLLDASKLLDTAFDPYTFMRDAYVIHRRKLAYDDQFNSNGDDQQLDDLDSLERIDDEQSPDDELDELDLLEETPLDALDELDALDALE
jgi:phospholipid-binding lipoprotein MlaA